RPGAVLPGVARLAGLADRRARHAVRGLPPQPDQDLGDRDLHRADLDAGAAEARGVHQLVPRLHPFDLRREDLADRTRVDGRVGVPADAGVDRTVIHAGAAADAAQGRAQLGVEEDAGPAVVEDQDRKSTR